MSEKFAQVMQDAVNDTANDFHLVATSSGGNELILPCSYQISELGFRPYKAGKASAEELQGQLDLLIKSAEQTGVDLGIETKESLAKLLIQQGLGIDCSNFAYRCQTLIHERLGLPTYDTTVYRDIAELLDLYENVGWRPLDRNGQPRQLTETERAKLEEEQQLSIAETASLFRRPPVFIIGSSHICADKSSEHVEPAELLPGDMVAFHKAGRGVVSHVAVIEEVDVTNSGVRARFWHPWHTRDFESGLRSDEVTITSGADTKWSHGGLNDPKRYEQHSFKRPAALAIMLSN